MNITSLDTMIFAKEFNGKIYYRASLSTKNKDGKYINGFIDVKFPKDITIEDRTKINIAKGFLTFYKNKDNKDVFYIVVQEFTKDEEITTIESIDAEQLDLPF